MKLSFHQANIGLREIDNGDNMSATETITARPIQIKYTGDNGFLVLNAKDDKGENIVLVGNYDKEDMSSEKGFLNRRFSFFGNYQRSNYGEQFHFSGYSILYENKEDEMFYFLSRMVSGLSDENAKNLIEKFGKALPSVIEENPDLLLNVKGIKQRKAKNIVQAWKDKRHLFEITSILAPFGISNSTIQKIFQTFKEDSVTKIKENPYVLTRIKGFGFKRADEIALKMGYNPTSIHRVKAGILYCMQEKVQNVGNTFAEKHILFKELNEVLDSNIHIGLPIEESFSELLQRNVLSVRVYEGVECVFLTSTYDKEQFIYQTLQAQKDRGVEICSAKEADDFLTKFEEKHSIKLSNEQREAVISAKNGSRVIAIAGAAGTGKTSVSKAILGMFEKKYSYDEIRCCALSGVAAARVRKQSGYESFTIHTLLGYDHISHSFIHNESNPLEASVILLDESSMVDVNIFYSLLKAIDFSRTHLIMLGDSAQLPPIGCGEIFNDILSFDITKKIVLTKIFRQSEENALTLIADEVRIGRVPQYQENKYKDFFFAKIDIPYFWYKKKSLSPDEYKAERDNIQGQIFEYMRKCIHRAKERVDERFKGIDMQDCNMLWDKLSYTQIIAPQKEGVLGVKNLNKLAQSIFNPKDDKVSIQAQEYDFCVGDKVIHLINKDMEIVDGAESTRRVFNGQIGIIEFIDLDNDEIIVSYPNEQFKAIYCEKNFAKAEITLAYAISIHKSQGSEFSIVFIPMTMNNAGMLNSKLIYTAMTRAKQQAIFMGETYAFEMGCKRKNELSRKTLPKIIARS